jgi:hypothetical protein
VNWQNSLAQLKPLLPRIKLLASLVMSNRAMSSNVLNATRVHNIVPPVSHIMSVQKTPMPHLRHVVNIALSVLNYTSILW